ncbi:MAG: prepilin-type N-terminal cleavage/methylation domain-containing protein [Nitrospirae bacterium]|nr:prepilin-type N-terminal cleavage/methylation domain-containing protein [Nitrospirota bacterium]
MTGDEMTERTSFPTRRRGGRNASRITHHALRSGSGFTLLELVISITIIGIIVLIIAGATRLGFRSVDAGEKKIESLERMRSSLWLINSQIQSEIPLTFDEDGSRKYYFKGTREFLQFSTNYSLAGGERGYVLAAYKVVPDDRGKQVLYLTENGIGMTNGTETKLLDVFDEIYFEYFYKEPAAEQGSWVQQWTDETAIPEKVRVHFVEGTKDLALIIPMRSRGSLAQRPSAAPGFTIR